jgi:hypothetical protein
MKKDHFRWEKLLWAATNYKLNGCIKKKIIVFRGIKAILPQSDPELF